MALVPPTRSLKSRALQLLAQREHSRTELRRKLAAQVRSHARSQVQVQSQPQVQSQAQSRSEDDLDAMPDADAERAAEPDATAQAAAIEVLLDWLEAHRYLSLERFIESRVHAREARYGNLRIRLELARHDAALGPDAEQRLRDSELERARTVWARKFGAAASDPGGRAKQARFLAGRGFGGEVIARVLREAGRPAGPAGLHHDDNPDDD